MDEILLSLPILFVAICSVTLIDSVGAIASRLLRFNYGYLGILSLVVYSLSGFLISGFASFNMVLIGSLIVGSFDATVGLKLAKICKANYMLEEEELKKINYTYTLKVMLLIGPAFFTFGYLLRDVVN